MPDLPFHMISMGSQCFLTILLSVCAISVRQPTLSVAIPEGWVDPFLIRHTPELFETARRPQENSRLEIPRSFLDTMVECLKRHVPDCCVDLAVNFDDVGISE
jgi:hypothetical protein